MVSGFAVDVVLKTGILLKLLNMKTRVTTELMSDCDSKDKSILSSIFLINIWCLLSCGLRVSKGTICRF